jgi:hypothetical protein
MGKPKAPPPPDLSGVIAASREAAQLSFQLGQDQLAWAKNAYKQDRKITKKVIDQALGSMKLQEEWAREDRKRYKDVYQPLEDEYIKTAKEYDSEAKREEEAGQAQADVSQQFDLARTAAQDRLESFGIDPSQTRSAALDVSARTQEAAARASAGNQARERVENTALAMKADAVNMGKGLPAQAAAGMAGATNSGNQAVNSGLATTATGSQAMNASQGWFANGINATQVWGNTINQGYRNQLDAWKAEQSASSGLGSALGLIGGMGLKLATGGMGFAEGGAVPDLSETQQAIPAEMSPSGGAAIDDVSAQVTDGGNPAGPAKLNVGEFVIPEDVVRWEGEKAFQTIIKKAREAQGAPDNARPEIRQAIPA